MQPLTYRSDFSLERGHFKIIVSTITAPYTRRTVGYDVGWDDPVNVGTHVQAVVRHARTVA